MKTIINSYNQSKYLVSLVLFVSANVLYSSPKHSPNTNDSLNYADSIFQGYFTQRVSLEPFVNATDSLKHVYLKTLIKYLKEESRASLYSGYTNIRVRAENRINRSSSLEDKSLYFPKGVLSMYLIYCTILKDTAFCCHIALTYRINQTDSSVIQFYKRKSGSKYYFESDYKFIGKRHLRTLANIFIDWYSKNKHLQIDEMRDILPLTNTSYNWDYCKWDKKR